MLDEINRHFEDEDNRITETLEKNMNEGLSHLLLKPCLLLRVHLIVVK
ncbi:ankyrin repeat domain protein [Wolbachia endosymbiont of Trichogramma pretiosum]|nr:ankyrin repeat domain protein [Wolbachia endosymbiont of Trichogramma pretiosum]